MTKHKSKGGIEHFPCNVMSCPDVMCFSCANIYRIKKGKKAVCPDCGFVVKRSTYERLLKYASEAVQFGYDYRRCYERDYRKDRKLETRHFLLIPAVVWNFIALAALTGIIGGASYAFVKKVIRKIGEKMPNVAGGCDKKLYNLLNDDKKLENFIQYIEDFHSGFPRLNQKIKGVIIQEILTNKASEISEERKAKKKIDAKRVAAEAIRSVILKVRPQRSDYKDFWNRLAKTRFEEVWTRIVKHQGQTFRTITGKKFRYMIEQNGFYPSRTQYRISKRDFEKAYRMVPIDGPGEIAQIVRGPSYVWAALHDHRICLGEW